MTICYSPWSMLTEGKGALPAIIFLFDFRSSSSFIVISYSSSSDSA